MTTSPQSNPATTQPKTSGLAIASLVCGIAGFCTVGLGCLVGIVLAIIALRRISRSQGAMGGRGFAIAGLIVSIVVLLIVVVAVVVGMVVYLITPVAHNNARPLAARAEVASIEAAAEMFRIDTGRYPTEEEGGLQALLTKPDSANEPMSQNWHGPYLRKMPTDPWGHRLVYRCPGVHNPQGIDVYSFGPDGREGTSDDIGNWESP
jgi:general secretion pathway protein G